MSTVNSASIHSKLAQQTRAALQQDPRTKDSTIKVVDENGVLTLRGTAVSSEARQAAAEIASRIPDVVAVLNDLTVEEQHAWETEAEADAASGKTIIGSQPIPPEDHPNIEPAD
jgi:hypothetical protein